MFYFICNMARVLALCIACKEGVFCCAIDLDFRPTESWGESKKFPRQRLTRQNRGGEETWKVWRALKKLELLSVAPRATLTHLSCSPNFPRASITRHTHAKHEQF